MATKKTTKKAVHTTKKTARPVSNAKPERKQRGFMSDIFRFGESYTSLVLGIIVVIAVASLLVTFSRTRNTETQNTDTDISATSTQRTDIAAPGSTYVVRQGDDLWQIAEQAYGDGHRFTEIVKANNIQDPNNLAAGTTLRIPTENTLEGSSPTKSPVAQAMTATVTPEAMVTAAPTAAPTAMARPTSTEMQNPQTTGTQTGTVSGNRYVVKAGDNLWDISVRAYGNGYRWTEIAKANNLQNPNIIHNGNNLVLPR